jgi:hypothetical protein
VVFLHTAEHRGGFLDLQAVELTLKYLRSKNISGESLAERFASLPGNGSGVAITF